MLCKQLLTQSKFKFCFLELSRIFFPNIFSLWLVESMGAEPMYMEGRLYFDSAHSLSGCFPKFPQCIRQGTQDKGHGGYRAV